MRWLSFVLVALMWVWSIVDGPDPRSVCDKGVYNPQTQMCVIVDGEVTIVRIIEDADPIPQQRN